MPTYTYIHLYTDTYKYTYTYTHINISEGPDGIARPTCGRAEEGPTVVAAAL